MCNKKGKFLGPASLALLSIKRSTNGQDQQDSEHDDYREQVHM
jgi:hypothetical protein